MWEVVNYEPEQLETQHRVVSREEAGHFHSGHQEQLNQKREHRPLPKDGKDSKYTQVGDHAVYTLSLTLWLARKGPFNIYLKNKLNI